MSTRPIGKIAEYLEQVSTIKQQWDKPALVFRGQENERWDLESSAERRLKKDEGQDTIPEPSFIEYHEKLLRKCKLKNYDRREGKSLHELELLADLRHHGAATCLMDFTRSALVALWFACEESKVDGKVFVVNIADERTFPEIAPDHISSKLIGTILRQSKPGFWHWTPAHLNERITAQQSLFLFGLPSPGEPDAETILIKLGKKAQIRQELKEIHGLHEESLFPDFTGFAYTQRDRAEDHTYLTNEEIVS